jgi:hypothetical protein
MNKKREASALKIINGHRTKKIVYETYLETKPEMAQKYLEFFAKNGDATYLKWNNSKQMFI